MTKPGEDVRADAAASLFSGERGSQHFERFLERAEREPAASAELDFLADLVAAAELEREELERSLGRPALARRPGRKLAWLAAAAALFLAGWFVLGRDGAPRTRDVAERAAPRYIASELRAQDSPLAQQFARAMEPYARGDYASAATALEALLAGAPDHEAARFYLAAAREALGELERAEELYRSVAAQGDDYLSEHAAWRLANLLVAREELDDARAELERLAARDGAFARNAAQLLERLGEQ